MEDKNRKPPDKVCAHCAYGKQRCRESCYCVKYGIIIGYSKTTCRGYEREQVSEHTDGT